MGNEYVIVNKSPIENRIEELEKLSKKDVQGFIIYQIIITELKQILSKSTPLIPEIKKAYNYGVLYSDSIKKTSNDYISNLKLDI